MMRTMTVAVSLTAVLHSGGGMDAKSGADSSSRPSGMQHVDLRDTSLVRQSVRRRNLEATELVCGSSIQSKVGSIGHVNPFNPPPACGDLLASEHSNSAVYSFMGESGMNLSVQTTCASGDEASTISVELFEITYGGSYECLAHEYAKCKVDMEISGITVHAKEGTEYLLVVFGHHSDGNGEQFSLTLACSDDDAKAAEVTSAPTLLATRTDVDNKCKTIEYQNPITITSANGTHVNFVVANKWTHLFQCSNFGSEIDVLLVKHPFLLNDEEEVMRCETKRQFGCYDTQSYTALCSSDGYADIEVYLNDYTKFGQSDKSVLDPPVCQEGTIPVCDPRKFCKFQYRLDCSYSPSGSGSEELDCSDVDCPSNPDSCPGGVLPFRPEGECCFDCPPVTTTTSSLDCSTVSCEDVTSCPGGADPYIPEDECCPDCPFVTTTSSSPEGHLVERTNDDSNCIYEDFDSPITINSSDGDTVRFTVSNVWTTADCSSRIDFVLVTYTDIFGTRRCMQRTQMECEDQYELIAQCYDGYSNVTIHVNDELMGQKDGSTIMPECVDQDGDPVPDDSKYCRFEYRLKCAATSNPNLGPSTSQCNQEVTQGCTYVFDSFLKDYRLFGSDNDTVVHQNFAIHVSCDPCSGSVVASNWTGPSTVMNKVDRAAVTEPVFNSGVDPNATSNDPSLLRVDWAGVALDAYMPDWTVSAVDENDLGFVFEGPYVEDLVFVYVHTLGNGLFSGHFEADITWGYRRSVTFKCVHTNFDQWEVVTEEVPVPLQQVQEQSNLLDLYSYYDESMS